VACPLQRHHRSRGLRFRRAPLGFQLPRDPSRRPSTSSVRRFGVLRFRPLRTAGRSLFLRASVAARSRLDLRMLSPSAHDPRTADTHPARSASPRPSPMCIAASHGVPVSSHGSIRSRGTSIDVPLRALSSFCRRCVHRLETGFGRPTSTATSARCALRPRISHRVFARFGNQRSALRANLTYEHHCPPQPMRRRSRPSASPGSVPAGRDGQKSASSLVLRAPSLDRSRRQNTAPRSLDAPSGSST
jgi:hypothetical protein